MVAMVTGFRTPFRPMGRQEETPWQQGGFMFRIYFQNRPEKFRGQSLKLDSISTKNASRSLRLMSERRDPNFSSGDPTFFVSVSCVLNSS